MESSKQPDPVKEHKKEGMFSGQNVLYIPCRVIPPVPCTESRKLVEGKEKKEKKKEIINYL